MSIETTWYIPNRVLYQRYGSTITTADVQALLDDSKPYFEQVSNRRMHTIVDFSEVNEVDANLAKLTKLTPIKENTGWYVMVITANRPMLNPMIKFLTVASSQLFGIRLRTVNSIDEAEAFLSEMDSEIAAALRRAS